MRFNPPHKPYVYEVGVGDGVGVGVGVTVTCSTGDHGDCCAFELDVPQVTA